MSLSEQTESQIIVDMKRIVTGFGLDPYPTHFELVPKEVIYEMAAYGIPGRMSHWIHGVRFDQFKSQGDYGLGKIFELVINTDPSYAFIQESNDLATNKLVIAHVLAHVDFFKHNASFQNSNTKMMDSAALQGDRLRKYAFEKGDLELEKILDAALSIEDCTDEKENPRKWISAQEYRDAQRQKFKDRQKQKLHPSSPYDDILELGEEKKPEIFERAPHPIDDEKNLLMFLAVHSPLEDWQKDVLTIVDNQAQYFRSQIKTKILNEGWASFWHIRALRAHDEEADNASSDFWRWAQLHCNVTAAHLDNINPYAMGLALWEDIDRKFRGEPLNGSRSEREYDFEGNEVDMSRFVGNPTYDIFRIRAEIPTDQAFLRNFLTPELVRRFNLFTMVNNGNDWVVESKDPKKIRDGLVEGMTNFGKPLLVIPEGGADYNLSGELYITHRQDGDRDGMDLKRMREFMPHLYRLWGKTVHLEGTFQEFEQKTVTGPWGFPFATHSLHSERLIISCSGESVNDISEKLVA